MTKKRQGDKKNWRRWDVTCITIAAATGKSARVVRKAINTGVFEPWDLLSLAEYIQNQGRSTPRLIVHPATETIKPALATGQSPMLEEKKKKKHMTVAEKDLKMAPIIARRIANRDIRDGQGDQIINKTRNQVPTKIEKTIIRKLLNMQYNEKFPRCPSRSYHKAENLDRADGFTLEQIRAGEGFHTKEKHKCQLCRCKNVAGAGTRGYWFWTRENEEGYKDVGHYGVGCCYEHSPLYSTRMGGVQVDQYRRDINERILAMKEEGNAPERSGGDLILLRDAVKTADIRDNTKAGLAGLMKLADEVLSQLNQHTRDKKSVEGMLGEICEVFGMPENMLSLADRARLVEIYYRKPLTELSRGVPISMSDKTSIELKMKLLKEVVQSAKSVFEVHEDEYTHNDDVVRVLERFYSTAEAYYRNFGEETWCKFLAALKDVGREYADKTMGTVREV